MRNDQGGLWRLGVGSAALLLVLGAGLAGCNSSSSGSSNGNDIVNGDDDPDIGDNGNGGFDDSDVPDEGDVPDEPVLLDEDNVQLAVSLVFGPRLWNSFTFLGDAVGVSLAILEDPNRTAGEQFDCPGGGTATIEASGDPETGTFTMDAVYDECAFPDATELAFGLEGITLDGTLDVVLTGDQANQTTTETEDVSLVLRYGNGVAVGLVGERELVDAESDDGDNTVASFDVSTTEDELGWAWAWNLEDGVVQSFGLIGGRYWGDAVRDGDGNLKSTTLKIEGRWYTSLLEGGYFDVETTKPLFAEVGGPADLEAGTDEQPERRDCWDSGVVVLKGQVDVDIGFGENALMGDQVTVSSPAGLTKQFPDCDAFSDWVSGNE